MKGDYTEFMNDYSALIARYGLISDQVDAGELNVVLTELARAIMHTNGTVVEFGCYRGTTSLYIRRVLDMYGIDHEFHAYDSFEGLPDKSEEDSSPAGLQFVRGELRASKKEFLFEFKKSNLRPPRVHKGWFDTLDEGDVPESIIFAFLDGDYYESVRTPLKLIESKLAPGATIIIDDYANEALPGAAKAVDEWVKAHKLKVRVISSLAVIRLN